jgi:hypothetical protein
MGSEHIVFGSDSLWYGGPQWQVEALWRFQIPDDIADRWGYPQLTEYDKRQILGLNSARLYGLYGRQAVGVGEPGSPYRQGNLARYAPLMQPGSTIDTVLEGVGYPTPITPVDSAVSVSADLIPDDNFTRLKKQRTEAGGGRSNARLGWMRTQ